MAHYESLLNRWQSAGVLDAEAARRIRVYESEQASPAGITSKRIGWQGMVALILGAILLACGVVLFVSAHWDQIGPGARYLLVIAMVAVFHLGGAWPGAVLLWAIAAAASWILLRDQAQQILTLLLFPAWIFSELTFASETHIGQDVYLGRFLLAWAVLYLTFFLGSPRKVVQGILFAVAAIASVVGITLMLESWSSWTGNQTFLPFGTRAWGWVDIAGLPLLIALFHFRKSFVPALMAIGFSIALPWCVQLRTEDYDG